MGVASIVIPEFDGLWIEINDISFSVDKASQLNGSGTWVSINAFAIKSIYDETLLFYFNTDSRGTFRNTTIFSSIPTEAEIIAAISIDPTSFNWSGNLPDSPTSSLPISNICERL